RPVAIKVLSPARAADPDGRARFLREARIAAQLMHPHIVPIFSVHEAAGFIFYAMAYVEGETVGERVRQNGPLAPADAVRVLMQVAAALAYAHARGVVHRDVTPENILHDPAGGGVGGRRRDPAHARGVVQRAVAAERLLL